MNSFISFAFIIIDLKIILREFLNQTDLFGIQTFYIYESSKFIMIDQYENFMLKIF